ncbi:hypothetical protein WDJ51_07200 [Rathayibacter sp. YIM 133350]|uniref:D-alanyl-D-alanine carboxypeptidase family protein n=1 Tax=Rathayibacter sp. YIM 133350 TaxID=3131992 RepID=UPI00307EBF49
MPSPGRLVGILVGTVVILGAGVYGPVTLLAPLPPVHAEVLEGAQDAVAVAPPVLPVEGASSVMIVGAGAPVATTGIADPVPVAGLAKIVAALVVIDAKPIDVGRTGPAVTISNEDYADYIRYTNEDARSVPVFVGETWTERELLQAVLLGSSNNHADTLARWAFGSVDAYVDAANTWLAAKGLASMHMADATGLDEGSIGTAADAARLGALVAQQPTLSEILANPATSLVGGRGVSSTTDYLSDAGISVISRSFTDAAGVCLLFTATLGQAPDTVQVAGAFLREPDYDTLDADVKAFTAAAAPGVAPVDVVARGTSYARFRSDWGQSADGVARVAVTRPAWQAAPTDTGAARQVSLDAFSTAPRGDLVGHVKAAGTSIPLELDAPIGDPGLGWRLLHPIPMIKALIAANK